MRVQLSANFGPMSLRQFGARFVYAASRARDEGVVWTISKLSQQTFVFICWLFMVPISLPLHMAGYRRLPVLTQHIGHLAGEIDCFLKKLHLGEINGVKNHYFVLAPGSKIANDCLLDYWREHISVISSPRVCKLLELMTSGPLLMRHSVETYLVAVARAAEYFSVEARWGNRPPLLKLRSDHQERGEHFLTLIGIPKDAWFVCVHGRDGSHSLSNESHSYRNTTMELMVPAMQEIVARGGWCIRMGDKSTKPLAPMVGVIDYAHHSGRSAELDVYLCASCKFFLGNTSGLFLLSSIFGVPSALTNQVPFAALGFRSGDLSIPKKIRLSGHSGFLTSAEILASPIANFRTSRLYAQANLELVENSADEIRELVLEMFEILEGCNQEIPLAELCRAQFMKNLKHDHYCYGSAAKISAYFLLRHPSIFLSHSDCNSALA